MATALLVPVTFYLSPIAAVATIVAASAMAIFSADIPGCLLRIPGTPASAAYTDEAYAMTRKGQAELALGAGLWFSAIGGIAGTISLVLLAPALAEIALNFSSFEYFWLGAMGLIPGRVPEPILTIANRVSLLLVAVFAVVAPLTGMEWSVYGLHFAAGGIVLIHRHFGWFVGEHGTGGSEYSVALIVLLLIVIADDHDRRPGIR